jgi:hypothetical protein
MLLLIAIYCISYSITDIFLNTVAEALLILSIIPLLFCSYFFLFRRGHTIASKIVSILLMLVLITSLFYINGPQTGLIVFFVPLLVGTQITFLGNERKIAFVLYGIIFLTIIFIIVKFSGNSSLTLITAQELIIERVLNFGGALFAYYI